MAVPQAFAVKWHRHQGPISIQRRNQARIPECITGEFPQFPGQVDFAAIFQAMDQVERPVVPGHRRPRELEGECQVIAIGTGKRAIDFPLKHLPAGLTEWFFQTRQVRVAIAAQRPPMGQTNPANPTG